MKLLYGNDLLTFLLDDRLLHYLREILQQSLEFLVICRHYVAICLLLLLG